MIANNGAVRVMDFGLARFMLEDVSDAPTTTESEPTLPIGPLTKTGATVRSHSTVSPRRSSIKEQR
jgi:hypothetical protein